MESNRRKFLKWSGLTGLGLSGIGLPNILSANAPDYDELPLDASLNPLKTSLIGPYGPWAASLLDQTLPTLSFRNNDFSDLEAWRTAAIKQTRDRMAIPAIGPTPQVKTMRTTTYGGLHIEELSWQLPYGRSTEALLLKPAAPTGKLPGILAFHDHGGNKYFGTKKITRSGDHQHPLMIDHQKRYYEGTAWANEIAKRGYIVLVVDAFTFASRRVMLQDVPNHLRKGLTDDDPDDPKNINSYNSWASDHEHIMAKSLFSAGMTWPAVFFAEDLIALDILCAREEVDASRIGCGGLSGGGLRTIFMGGLDPRIKCAVCVGFMTTWRDLVLNKSHTHTWMTYVPLLPNELELSEVLGLRAPMPTLVLNDTEDTLFTLEEMKRADTILGQVYRKANASDHYHCSFYPGPHKFDKAMQTEAFGWFDQWLKS